MGAVFATRQSTSGKFVRDLPPTREALRRDRAEALAKAGAQFYVARRSQVLMRKDDATMATSDDMREQIRSLTEKFDGLEKKVDGLGLRVGGLEQKVDLLPTRDDLTGFKDEIINNFRILAEDAKASARNAAEGYDATLKKVERDLVELNQKVDNQLSDHGRALANHNQRLVTLERRRRRPRRD